jgi:hypothetical protein
LLQVEFGGVSKMEPNQCFEESPGALSAASGSVLEVGRGGRTILSTFVALCWSISA